MEDFMIGMFCFSSQVFPHHVPGQHTVDSRLLLPDGLVGHSHRGHRRHPARGDHHHQSAVCNSYNLTR